MIFDGLSERFQQFMDNVRGPELCSECFSDRGLALEAEKIGRKSDSRCPQCKSRSGAKLSKTAIYELATKFFRHGTFVKTEFGGAPRLRLINQGRNRSQVRFPDWLKSDARLIESKLGMSISHYGPAIWRVGESDALARLRETETQVGTARDAIEHFPHRQFVAGETFYRLRKQIPFGKETDAAQYDAPPETSGGVGRLDEVGFPVLYGSQDIEICVHECRITRADEFYLGTLKATKPLKLLDLCANSINDGPTPFESIYLAVQMIFAAESHSYGIARAIARAAKSEGYDGLAYPSYFSTFRSTKIPNVGLFGRPIADGRVELLCANRLQLDRV